MEEEFSLSEKIIENQADSPTQFILVEDVKEFIKIVESDYQDEWNKATENNSIIDKNKLKEIFVKKAGERLTIENKEEFNLSEKEESDFGGDFYYWKQDIKEFIRRLDWDRDDYDELKLEIEKRFGADCNRALWEYAFRVVCRMFEKKKLKFAGEKLTK